MEQERIAEVQAQEVVVDPQQKSVESESEQQQNQVALLQQEVETKDNQLQEVIGLVKYLVAATADIDLKNMSITELQNQITLIKSLTGKLDAIKDEYLDEQKQKLNDFLAKLEEELDSRFGEENVEDAKDDLVSFWSKYGSKIWEAVKFVAIAIIIIKLIF